MSVDDVERLLEDSERLKHLDSSEIGADTLVDFMDRVNALCSDLLDHSVVIPTGGS